MRYVHPVSVHENFVASGTYVYRRDGVETGCLEHWTMHSLPDGAWFMRSDRDCRSINGRSLLMEVWRSPENEGGTVERFDLHAYGQPKDNHKQTKVTFALDDGAVLVGRTFNRTDRHDDELSLPAGGVLQNGGLLYLGARIRTALNGQSLTLVTHGNWADALTDFKPQIVQLQASAQDETSVSIDGKAVIGQAVQVTVTPNDADTLIYSGRYVVNAHDVILQADLDNGLSIHLEQYSQVK